MVALLLHAAGCFVRTTPIPQINPAIANIEDESRVKCLGYDSWRYVIVGVILYAASILYGAIRSWRKTTVIAIIAHPERTLPLPRVLANGRCGGNSLYQTQFQVFIRSMALA